ncbi:hypothetical protein GK047_09135 [Paenibacillus sp. SYP-B3998]|uniref:UDP-N-acetylmuramyl pentapeptide phosphotransferase n=1 Tax=Paenibacillus sp. SYP-B3998 TaxID=2678564 RepID=A0A6G3ZVD6_9BACL|nr:hypothetical protein [Paenibacillus sp. SYP-B3998]NEW06173.1 hypothetical protein [Paenibacillus sp. SYP-B3998]
MVLIGSLFDLIVLIVLGRWFLPHVQRFLEAHGRTESNYLGIPIARGMGIVLWLLIWSQEIILMLVLLVEPFRVTLTMREGFLANETSIGRAVTLLESNYRMFMFAATFIFLLGWTDDLLGSKSVKGLKGHWRYWRDKRVISTGVVKALGTLSVAAWLLIATRNGKIPIWEMGIELLLLVLITNSMNLLDVRPGRSLKVFIFTSLGLVLVFGGKHQLHLFPITPVLIGGFLLYRHDVQAKGMLGDAGANLLGFTLGYGFITVGPLGLKIFMLVVLIYLHHRAETSSLTRLIEQNKFLNWLDRLGRT